ncbi:hypothetical protein BKA60DRAFT_188854 [Fusarium oxysporum]|nr:hypothetical protein BKA60DRAFT_188854 [Fusarium oxysporum]
MTSSLKLGVPLGYCKGFLGILRAYRRVWAADFRVEVCIWLAVAFGVAFTDSDILTSGVCFVVMAIICFLPDVAFSCG